MDLDELKLRLGIPLDDASQDSKLTFMLEDAVDFVKRSCNNSFDEGLPPVAKRVIAKYVQFDLSKNDGIKSESIDGLSQTFESAEERNASLIAELSQAGLRRIRFIPL